MVKIQKKCRGCGNIYWSKPEQDMCQRCRNMESKFKIINDRRSRDIRRRFTKSSTGPIKDIKELTEKVVHFDSIKNEDYDIEAKGKLWVSGDGKLKAFVFNEEETINGPKLKDNGFKILKEFTLKEWMEEQKDDEEKLKLLEKESR